MANIISNTGLLLYLVTILNIFICLNQFQKSFKVYKRENNFD